MFIHYIVHYTVRKLTEMNLAELKDRARMRSSGQVEEEEEDDEEEDEVARWHLPLLAVGHLGLPSERNKETHIKNKKS